MNAGLRLSTYKIRIADGHVRAVPATGLEGNAFVGPGVDIRGEEAAAIIRAAQPLLVWLDAREPGVVVRAISVRTDGPRVLVSLGPTDEDPRPRALRFEPPSANELRDAGQEAEQRIREACVRALERRKTVRTSA